ncbi:hypothetical protein SRABI27_00848 [Pedobacter sp. Bi27]|uniref:hypothetical protein n=1 Tax=unclassified Pedobacter TaxID=2628915 RepID=UPI001DC7B14D|nr:MULTISPECIES: hypothetical protein [unclassified Pedobacter]CAH0163757.1 hypothetical protein SRABI126_00850 [Pedobacter sp. Bi126]CAH0164292.1 hypothetical protein SRABI27_00848 [Pedobacter sp. Bi27]CAH0282585.1 hypothetical protein SRABI36_04062 [Pedobacter sp. Bi36]
MKKLVLLVVSCLVIHVVAAQVKVHTDMRTPTWNLIGLKYDAEIAPKKWGSVFPLALKALHNKVIELPGYIIPTKVGSKFSEFMFSIVPIASCPYCGSGDIPSMVQVKMLTAIPITEKPIKLKGIFIINDSGDDRSEFFLLNAKQL